MGEADMDREPLEILAEEFAQRLRRGESPSVELYAAAHPEIAGEIRRLFPTIAVMERLKARSERSSHGLASLGPIQLDRLGDFRIIREIGRGGMGIVFEAEQESLGRRVALKVLPRQALLEPQHLARFRREAQLASRLHHTNIVQVYGVGEQDGFHYYIMQFVRGVGLDQVIQRLRDLQSPSIEGAPGAAGAPNDLLQAVLRCTVNQGKASSGVLTDPEYYRWVARLGEQVAAALGYAHEQGTLHRDVKPSNLLLDDQGTVWVTDFGLARATHAPEVTQGGDLTGTLRYLAPERLNGQADERGDIYGLGLTLYELLTLRPAYDETDRSALIRRVAQESPPLPRAVNPAIPRDLETVVVKAISREPAHRYATAAAVADDLRRFQEDRPVLARRIGPVGRLGRWCRRNKIVAALTASTMMLIVTVAVVALVGYVRARNALAREAEERRRAEAVAALAGEALDRVFARLGPSRVVVSELPVGGTGIQIVGQPAISQETVSLLEEMLPFYDRLSSQTGNDVTLQRRVADARRRLGDIRQRLGRFDQAIVAYRQSIEIYGTLAAQQPKDEALRVCMAEAYNEMGKTWILLRQGTDAGVAHRQALELLHAVGASSPPSARFELARTHFYLGQRVAPEPGAQPARLGRGPPRDGSAPRLGPGEQPGRPPVSDPALDPDPNRRMRKQHLEQAAGLLTALNREQPKNPDYRYLLALCYRELLPPPGQDRDHVADRAVEILEQLAAEYPQIADYRFDLCETYAAAVEAVAPGQPAGALAATEERLRKALALSQQLTAQHPDTPEYQASQARIHHGLGEVFRQSRQLDAAEESDRRALEIQGLLAKRFPEVLTYQVWEAALCNSLADLLLQRAKLTELRGLAEMNIARTSQLLEKHPDLWYLHALLMDANRTLALAWRAGGDAEQAARAEAEAERHRAFLGADARGPRSGPATHPTP